MRFELFIAARYLRARRRQAVVGFVTLISVVGVAAGVASLIIALAITNGMKHDLRERLLSSTAQVQLLRTAGDGIGDWRSLLERLRHEPHVTAAAPGLYEQVLIARGARSGGALLKGIVPADEATVSDLLQHMASGSAAALAPRPCDSTAEDTCSGAGRGPEGSDVNSSSMRRARGDSPGASFGNVGTAAAEALPPIVIGHDLAESIGALVGDTVLVISPQGALTPLGMMPRYRQFRVAGIFASGFYQYDSSYGFLRLADAQRLFSEPDVISVISFKVDDLYNAAAIGRELEQAAGKGFETTNWMEQNRELFRALKLEQVVTFIVLALIVVVAALNILIALTMMVMEKTRDIAVLMSFGVSAAQVRRIFLLQGLLISLLGTGAGLIVGYAASFAGGHWRFIRLDAAVYSLDYLPFQIRWTDGLIVAGLSLGVSLLATLYPSSSAAGILPAEALRYE
jgi:lipoprotein-releasing system permease protein